jgi:PIN domain nuclease of toxin-antitoxin system
VTRYLIDTQIFIWFVEGDERISKNTKSLLSDDRNKVFYSAASAWEMAIKVSIKKLKFGEPLADIVNRHCPSDFDFLPIRLSDVLSVEKLPLHHRDPFDRLLVAQAKNEDLEIISTDKIFDAYGVRRVG